MAAGVAIDALFAFIDADKLKLADLFTRIDKDRSGTLEKEELQMCLTSASSGVSCLDSLRAIVRASACFAKAYPLRWRCLPTTVQCWASAWSRITWTRS